MQASVELAESKISQELLGAASVKDVEIERLKAELKSSSELVKAQVSADLNDVAVKKDAEIERLKADLANADIAKSLELNEALGAVEKE